MSDGESNTDEMACNELVELVTDYLEERLTERDAERLEAHLAICEGCRNYVDQMRETIAALGHLPEEPLAPEVREELLEAFHGWRRT
jgi:predicted anti-sigma-YlaC factor YlaD